MYYWQNILAKFSDISTGAAGAGAAGAAGVGGAGTGAAVVAPVVAGTTGAATAATAPAMMTALSTLLPGIGLGLLKGMFLGKKGDSYLQYLAILLQLNF